MNHDGGRMEGRRKVGRKGGDRNGGKEGGKEGEKRGKEGEKDQYVCPRLITPATLPLMASVTPSSCLPPSLPSSLLPSFLLLLLPFPFYLFLFSNSYSLSYLTSIFLLLLLLSLSSNFLPLLSSLLFSAISFLPSIPCFKRLSARL